jgi:hypothetical protein
MMQVGFRPLGLPNFDKTEIVAARLLDGEYTEAERLSSIVLTEGFPGENLLSKCQSSRGHLCELSIKGSSDAPVTTITGEDLKRLNEDPDLLFTLASVSIFLAPNINAEDVTSFLLGLEPVANLEELELSIPLNDAQLIYILNRHTNLKKLSLWHTENLTDQGFSALAERGSQFEKLIINGISSSITHQPVNELFSSLENVSLFYFKGNASIDPVHLKNLFSNSIKLEICNLCRLTTEAVKHISEDTEASCSKQWNLSRDELYFKKDNDLNIKTN